MTRLLVLVDDALRDTAVAGRALDDHWRWLAGAAGLEARIVAVDAREPTPSLLVDGRFAALEVDTLRALATAPTGSVIVAPTGEVLGAHRGSSPSDPERAVGDLLRDAGGAPCAVASRDEALAFTIDPSAIERIVHARHASALAAGGARILDPGSTWIDTTATVAPGARIAPQVTLRGHTTIASGAEIRTGCWLEDTTVGPDARVDPYTVCEGAIVGSRCIVGPFAHLRPGATLLERARVGNFVEVKAATLGVGAKASHLAYLGDASIGDGANIGAGTITCNYDGVRKHRTTIGERAFIGSNSALVAPVRVGDDAVVGAGSVVTRDVPADALFVERAAPRTIPNGARRLRQRNEESP